MKKLIVIILSLSILSCETQNDESNVAVEKLQSENDVLQHKIDSLNKVLEEVQIDQNYWFDVQNEGAYFLENGIKDPEKAIESSLRKRMDLIPIEGVLGGTMRFGNIKILSNNWVIADYNDGHVEGRAIYKYQLTKNNTFEFQILDSKAPE